MSAAQTETKPQASPPQAPLPSTAASSGNGASNGVPPVDGADDGPFQVKTMAELGNNMPVGYVTPDGPRVRTFRLRPFRMKEEKELATIKERAKGLQIGSFTAQVLTKMIATIGPHSFDAMKESERRVIIASLDMADVLYIYTFLRYEALGAETPIGMDLSCPACKTPFHFDADLRTLKTRVVPDEVKSLRRSLTLRDGLVIQGERRHVLYLEPLKWGAFESPHFNIHNRAERELATIRFSIVAAEGVKMEPLFIHDREMDELTKYDMALLIRDIEEHSPGPQMVVDIECDACRTDFRQMIDWTSFEGFFSLSSRRRR